VALIIKSTLLLRLVLLRFCLPPLVLKLNILWLRVVAAVLLVVVLAAVAQEVLELELG
jgi:hypothetical protein